MGLKQLWIIAILNIIFIVTTIQVSNRIVQNGIEYQMAMREHVKVLDFKDRLLNKKEWVLLISGEFISFIDDTEWIDKKNHADEHLVIAQDAYKEAKNESWIIFYLSIGLLLLTILLYLKSEKIWFALGSSCIAIATVYLYIGLFTPILQISAYSENLEIPLIVKFDDMASSADDLINTGSSYLNQFSDYLGYDLEIPETHPFHYLTKGYEWDFSIQFEGRMYYFHQSKDISGLITLLFKDKNYPVAWAILSFSVLIPALKLLITLLLIYFKRIRKMNGFLFFVKVIGKWSMADVFVAACFLAYLSFYNMNVGIETESKALIGIYFFMCYVILSILSSIFVWWAIQKEKKLHLHETAL